MRIVAQEMSVKDILTADIATIALKFLDEQRMLTAADAAAADDDEEEEDPNLI